MGAALVVLLEDEFKKGLDDDDTLSLVGGWAPFKKGVLALFE